VSDFREDRVAENLDPANNGLGDLLPTLLKALMREIQEIAIVPKRSEKPMETVSANLVVDY
jgi:hypothetical protein